MTFILSQVEKFSATFNISSSEEVTLSTSVASTRAFFTYGVESSKAEPDDYIFSGELTSTSTLLFERSEGTFFSPAEILGYVVEGTTGITVEQGLQNDLSFATSATSTLATIIDSSKTFLLINSFHGGSEYSKEDTFGANIFTSGTAIRVTFHTGGNGMNEIHYQAVEMDNIEVQRGRTTLGATETSVAIGISSVSTDRTFPLISGWTEIVDFNNIGGRLLRAQITGSTTLTVDREVTDDNDMNVEWQVVEFTSTAVSVERVDTSMSIGDEQNNEAINQLSSTSNAFAITPHIWIGGKGSYNGR